MRKGIDRRGLDKHWARVLPEHMFSTTGLLAILLGQCTSGRKPHPSHVHNVLESFLSNRVRQSSFDIALPLDAELSTAYSFAGLQAPQALCQQLPLDGLYLVGSAFQ